MTAARRRHVAVHIYLVRDRRAVAEFRRTVATSGTGVVRAVGTLRRPSRCVGTEVEVEVTTSRAAVAQGGGCSAVVSVQRACNPTEMAAAGHAPRAPTRAQPDAERSGLDKPGLVWTRG